MQKLVELCAAFNSDKQQGKMLPGISPDDGFEQFANLVDPPVKFTADSRYLLAHHKRPTVVTRNGITLRFGKQTYNYRNANTGALIGQRVLAWFNPELPEVLSVTDMDRKNAFCVGRSEDVPAMDAPLDVLNREQARINEHQAPIRARYRVLKARRQTAFRRTITDRETIELGEQIGQGRVALETEQRENQRRENAAGTITRQLGIALTPDKLRRPGVASAAKRLQELLESEPDTEMEAKP
jgi:hypothetical protein